MAKCKSLLCPFEGSPEYCFRHKEKGTKEVKPKKAIPKVSDKKKSKAGEEKERKERLKIFFEEKIQDRPELCQNCDAELINSMFPNARTIIAHLLAKAHYQSVETNDDNFIYLCASCHNRMDLQCERFHKESKLSGLIKERVKLLTPLLTQEELKRIPDYLTT